LWAKTVLAWDSLAQRWSRFVIDYDLVAQSRVLSSVGKGLSGIAERLRGKPGAAIAFEWAWPGGVATVLLGTAALYLARRKRRAGTRGRTLSAAEARARRLWLATRHRLEKSRIALAPSSGVREAALRIAIHVPEAKVPVEKIAEAVLAARWGGRPLERREARALLESLDAALR
jgi:hypothetical protein